MYSPFSQRCRRRPGMMVDTAEAVAGRIVEQIESGGAEAQM